MKIKVSSLPPQGEDCREIYIPRLLDLDRFDVQVKKPLTVDYYIRKEGDELFVKAKVKVTLEITCARCLEVSEVILDKEYDFEYRVRNVDIIDTTEDLRQEIILDFPLKPLCKPDCLGLCIKCGGNLNKGECRCK